MGKSPDCLRRLKRSSAAAATTMPSTTSAAAASNPCAIRYSRSSRFGQCSRLKRTASDSPLTPKIAFIDGPYVFEKLTPLTCHSLLSIFSDSPLGAAAGFTESTNWLAEKHSEEGRKGRTEHRGGYDPDRNSCARSV